MSRTQWLAHLLQSRRAPIAASFSRHVGAATDEAARVAVEAMSRFIDQIVCRIRGDGPMGQPLAGDGLALIVRGHAAVQASIFEALDGSGLPCSVLELRSLTRALVGGIARAAAELAREREAELGRVASEELAFLAHELRGSVGSMLLAYDLATRGKGALDLRALAMLQSGLARLNSQVEVALMRARLEVPLDEHAIDIPVPQLIAEVLADTSLEVQAKGLRVEVEAVTCAILHGDKRLLLSALSNLLRNAVKFSPPGAAISLRVIETEGRLVIEIEDECGGLPPGQTDELFEPHVQRGSDRSGFGLGLAIARRAIGAHAGSVRVRDLPSRGCVFVLELPIKNQAS